jgi:hypothetical protein
MDEDAAERASALFRVDDVEICFDVGRQIADDVVHILLVGILESRIGTVHEEETKNAESGAVQERCVERALAS